MPLLLGGGGQKAAYGAYIVAFIERKSEMFESTVVCGHIALGIQGEHHAIKVSFAETATIWRERFGEGTFELLHQRNGDAAPYPIVMTMENDVPYWYVTNADTAIAGAGKCELRYVTNNVIIKSCTFITDVTPSLIDASEEVPEPEQAWVDQVLNAAEEVKDAVTHNPIIGDNGNWLVWDADKGEYIDTGVKASGSTDIEVPTKLSQLVNDVGYITEKDIPKVNVPTKLSELSNDIASVMPFYDTVINSQEEFDLMLASENWNGAKNVFLNCSVGIGEGGGSSALSVNIPNNVLLINGNGHSISGDYCDLCGSYKTVIKNTHLNITRGYISDFYGLVNCHFYEQFPGMPAHISWVLNFINCDCADECGAVLADCNNVWMTTEQADKFDTSGCSPYAKIYITDTIPSEVDKEYVDKIVGDIDSVLDSILAIENSFMGGDSV